MGNIKQVSLTLFKKIYHQTSVYLLSSSSVDSILQSFLSKGKYYNYTPLLLDLRTFFTNKRIIYYIYIKRFKSYPQFPFSIANHNSLKFYTFWLLHFHPYYILANTHKETTRKSFFGIVIIFRSFIIIHHSLFQHLPLGYLKKHTSYTSDTAAITTTTHHSPSINSIITRFHSCCCVTVS